MTAFDEDVVHSKLCHSPPDEQQRWSRVDHDLSPRCYAI